MQKQEIVSFAGVPSLNPMQEKVLSEGFLECSRALVSAPTASGKTLLALAAIAKNFTETRKKAVYVVPLRALAAEKHREFNAVLGPLGASVALSTGDYDSSSFELKEYDVVIATSEKLDSLLRHDMKWLRNVGLVVVDEVHLLNDAGRGATLEIVLTKVKQAGCRLVCLSATIPNGKELAQWLDARLFESDYRPTKLVLGISDGKRVFFADEEADYVEGVGGLVEQGLKEKNGKGQALVFVSTRRTTQSLASELGKTTREFLGEGERKGCAELAEKALKALPSPTSQCRLLAECIRNGVAFHHAGVPSKQREAIEEGFKQKRCIKAIVCTTTLAMGIDYPASWVIVRDLKRFNGAFAEFMPALDCAQMVGRAGRPRFDDKGVGILMCGERELGKVRDKYVLGGLEDIYSKLSFEPVLRGHCLALIASNHCNSFKELFEFFNRTFYAFQYGDSTALLETVEKVVAELKEADFTREKKGVLVATPVGKRVSELYIDPLSAKAFIGGMREKTSDFYFLLLLNEATEARPLIGVKRGEENALWEEMYSVAPELAADEEDALERYKSAKLMNAWINEETEEKILEDFDVPPGVVHSRVRNMEWLAYSFAELAFLLNATQAHSLGKQMRKRILHGIKAELLGLTSVKGIGRVRARRLWNAGIRSAEDYGKAGKDEVRKIIRSE